jgi:uncharacterized protein YndB with AHSA1/START domain
LTAGREVRVTRTFDAPRELVFRAWLDPEQIAAWMAPAGLEVPHSSIEVDPRPGGVIAYSMVDASSGQSYPVRFEIVEMREPELLVLSSPPAPEMGIPARLVTRAEFETIGERTTVTVTQGPHTEQLQRQAGDGWTSCLEKLATLLAG